MTRHTQALAATVVGAVLGGLAGYLVVSERGRAWRRQLEPQVEDLLRELSEARGSVTRVLGAVGEGWQLLTGATPEPSDPYMRTTGVTPDNGQAQPF